MVVAVVVVVVVVVVAPLLAGSSPFAHDVPSPLAVA
jgi:hypothetical protein